MDDLWAAASFGFSRRIRQPLLPKAFQTLSLPWQGIWAAALAFAWLLPNHYLPWSAFHADAWSGIVMGVAFAVILFLFAEPVVWHAMPLITGVLVGIPLIQVAFGLLSFAGQAWVSAAYLLGFLLALVSGARWESHRPGQLPDTLFLAIGGASILSVGLQLYQWLGLNGLDIWSIGLAGRRPYANLAQPNQLGTLLLWGLLACTWAVLRGKIRVQFAILMACFLSVGIVFTASRTAWAGLFLLVCSAWVWRKWWPSKWVPWLVIGVTIFFLFSNWFLAWLGQRLGLLGGEDIGSRLHSHIRLDAWRLFTDAILQHPWIGYGWTGVSKAQLAVALNHPSLGMTFAHSHNLFLDLVLWCGLPIGLGLVTVIIRWFLQSFRNIKNIEDLILFMFLAVIGNHAMLELPLHYAYFLLPTGMIIGALNTRLGERPVFYTPRWFFAVIWLGAAILLAGIVRDYLRVEDNFYALRFEEAHIGSLPPRSAPDVALLTQLQEEIWLARFVPQDDIGEADIQRIQNVADAFPGLGEMYKLALALAYHGKVDEAQTVLKKGCKVVSTRECDIAKRSWARKSLQEPKIAAIPWPD